MSESSNSPCALNNDFTIHSNNKWTMLLGGKIEFNKSNELHQEIVGWFKYYRKVARIQI